MINVEDGFYFVNFILESLINNPTWASDLLEQMLEMNEDNQEDDDKSEFITKYI